MECSGTARKEVLKHATAWMNLENVEEARRKGHLLSESTCTGFFVQNRQIQRLSDLVVPRGRGREGVAVPPSPGVTWSATVLNLKCSYIE